MKEDEKMALQITLAVLPRETALVDVGTGVGDCKKVGERAGEVFVAVLEKVRQALDKKS